MFSSQVEYGVCCGCQTRQPMKQIVQDNHLTCWVIADHIACVQQPRGGYITPIYGKWCNGSGLESESGPLSRQEVYEYKDKPSQVKLDVLDRLLRILSKDNGRLIRVDGIVGSKDMDGQWVQAIRVRYQDRHEIRGMEFTLPDLIYNGDYCIGNLYPEVEAHRS